MLLDALDEAAHIKQDCTPVIHLISKTFRLLPPQVKFILTSRLEQANKLKDWSPRVIEPTAQSNMTDVSILIKAKVKASDLNATGRINPLHHDQAVKLMVERSKGQAGSRLSPYPKLLSQLLSALSFIADCLHKVCLRLPQAS